MISPRRARPLPGLRLTELTIIIRWWMRVTQPETMLQEWRNGRPRSETGIARNGQTGRADFVEGVEQEMMSPFVVSAFAAKSRVLCQRS